MILFELTVLIPISVTGCTEQTEHQLQRVAYLPVDIASRNANVVIPSIPYSLALWDETPDKSIQRGASICMRKASSKEAIRLSK